MAFLPTSTIYLCNVALDSTYKHQFIPLARENQQAIFKNRTLKTFSEYLTVRTKKPDGGVYSSVKVGANIETLYNYNYMFYQNANHGSRWFYAFITNLIYINENTTEIVFETDVFQTWFLDCDLLESYVVREHSATDEIGDNIVPESFNFQDYSYEVLKTDMTLVKWGYLVGCSENKFDSTLWEEWFGDLEVNGVEHSGIYQGIHFFYFETRAAINSFIEMALKEAEESILFITAIPYFNVSNANITNVGVGEKNGGYVNSTVAPNSKEIDLSFIPKEHGFGGDLGYFPVNKKLYTSPYFKMIVSNHNGETGEYNIEDFSLPSAIKFKMYGDISANPSITLVPMNYKGLQENYDSGISISNFPQCSFNTDTFKLWLTKNQFGNAVSGLTALGEIVGGIAMISTGAGATVGAGLIGHGASSVMGTINNVYQASREPNKTSGGGAKSNLLTAMGENRFSYYLQTIKPEHAKTIDNFFSMYGYQTNKVKIPNTRVRTRFTYTQTADCNIKGKIPDEDLKKLKAIFNNGITLWIDLDNVANYGFEDGYINVPFGNPTT